MAHAGCLERGLPISRTVPTLHIVPIYCLESLVRATVAHASTSSFHSLLSLAQSIEISLGSSKSTTIQTRAQRNPDRSFPVEGTTCIHYVMT